MLATSTICVGVDGRCYTLLQRQFIFCFPFSVFFSFFFGPNFFSPGCLLVKRVLAIIGDNLRPREFWIGVRFTTIRFSNLIQYIVLPPSLSPPRQTPVILHCCIIEAQPIAKAETRFMNISSLDDASVCVCVAEWSGGLSLLFSPPSPTIVWQTHPPLRCS